MKPHIMTLKRTNISFIVLILLNGFLQVIIYTNKVMFGSAYVNNLALFNGDFFWGLLDISCVHFTR